MYFKAKADQNVGGLGVMCVMTEVSTLSKLKLSSVCTVGGAGVKGRS